MPYGPFPDLPSYRAWLENVSAGTDPLFLAVLDTAADPARPVGVGSFLRIQPRAGSIEVGHLHYSPLTATAPTSRRERSGGRLSHERDTTADDPTLASRAQTDRRATRDVP